MLAMCTIFFCGLHLISLSSWPHELIPSPVLVYRLNAALTLIFLYLFLAFRFSLTEMKRWHLMFLLTSGTLLISSFIFYCYSKETDFNLYYRFSLLAVLITTVFFQVALSSKESKFEYIMCFIAIAGFMHDIARIWGFSSMGNISPYTSSIFSLGIAFHFSHGLIPFFKTALKAKDLEFQSKQNAAIARTTQSLAHDVRKPFSMLKMVLEAVSDSEDPHESREIAKASLPEVNQAMASVEGMIQDVMQIGSNSKPNQEIASPEAIIDAAINELFRVFPEASVEIEYELNHEHSLFIDTMRVSRIFSNILVNAVQAMNGKGKIWIKTLEQNGFIEFRLRNSGSCIPKESLSKLFDAFFTSGKKGGTGLGLAIAQKVVNEHGGAIRCESDRTQDYPDGFVEFVFTLPISNELNPSRSEPLPHHSRIIHEQLAKLKRKESGQTNTDELQLERVIVKRLKAFAENLPNILIVDDEAVYRNSVAGLISNFRGGESAVSKLPIFFAKNATEAIEMVKKHAPFLVIQDVDLGLASRNGIEVIKQLRKEGFLGRICVHSNRFLFDDQKTAFEAGADSVLPKPMSRAHLFKLISSALPEEFILEKEPVARLNQPATEIASKHLKRDELRIHEAELNETIEGAYQKETIDQLSGLDVPGATKPRVAYIDDAITFTLSWKFKLKEKIDLETFASTTKFLQRVQEEPEFLRSLDVIVTDYYFGPEDPLNGKTFAAELRRLGYEKPIYLASNGDFAADECKPCLNGVIGKDVPEVETILGWIEGK